MEKLNVVRVKLIDDVPLFSQEAISSPEKAVRLIGDELKASDREMFCVLHLNAKGKPLSMSVVSVGELTATSAHPREVFKSSILANAACVILMHNHPSGDVTPSEDDKKTTRRLTEVGNLLGIRVVDHIIVAEGRSDFYSFKRESVVCMDSLHDERSGLESRMRSEKEWGDER